MCITVVRAILYAPAIHTVALRDCQQPIASTHNRLEAPSAVMPSARVLHKVIN